MPFVRLLQLGGFVVGNYFRSMYYFLNKRKLQSYQKFIGIAFFFFVAVFFTIVGYFCAFWFSNISELKPTHQRIVREVSVLEERLVGLESGLKKVQDSFGFHLPENVLLRSVPQVLKSRDQGGPIVSSSSLQVANHYIQKAINGISLRMSRDEGVLSIAESILIRQKALNLLMPKQLPVEEFRITSGYGPRVDPINHRPSFHVGYDFAAPIGSQVMSVAPGIVKRSGSFGSYGHIVDVDHGHGLVTRYAHLGKVFVHVGDLVEQGSCLAQIGVSGRSTGPHLHFEVLKYGVPQDPGLFFIKSDQYK
ncbi:M23 family metallopeptidase [Candidatus Ichthyocystis sparus]|uniref:M23 family metallopeptidase n=1 Tax=Candidatus Ichthyocystis sparus TaxID=1561004 RepID=UPI000B89165B|nr:M23 family metallopeptidase [Candidatus Ichthyocystis sparus]